MPIPVERICLMLIIRNLLLDNGLFVWYSDPMIRNKKMKYTRRFIDGFLSGSGKKREETFYIELHENEIETMIELSGFKIDIELSKQLKKFSFRNIVYYAKPKERIIFSRVINLPDLIKKGTYHKENYYTSTDFKRLLEFLAEVLKLTEPGKSDAYRYQDIIAYILKNIFDGKLTDMEIETEGREGDIRIDITFRNLLKSGFFKDIKDAHSIPCPYIKFECKNLSKDPENPEYDQLKGRLDEPSGMFGILVVRKIEDNQKCIKHCKDRLSKSGNKEYIIVLEDSDIFKLIDAKLYNPSEIDEILHKKLKVIIF